MKKYFYFAAAAIVALASCQKNQVIEPVDDETPVAVSMKANAPVSGVATKAAVNAWDNTPIVGFATKTLDGKTTSVYAEKALTVAADGSIVLEDTDNNNIPYYYAEKAVYDFYAYYSGDATFTKTTDGVYNVTFSGDDDIMYAMADKSKDIPTPNTDGVTEADLYSAWAARRGVQPTLVFQHALTKFDFNIIGADDKQSERVRIDYIGIQSKNSGVMTVVGPTQSFVVTDVNKPAETDWLWLNKIDPTQQTATLGVNVKVGDQKLAHSLMVAPGMETVNVIVRMSQLVNGTYVAIPEAYEIPVDIEDVEFASIEVPTDAFAAGYAYTLNIKVYGPQEIKIDATLTPWENGGSHEFDPDDDYRPSTPPAPAVVVEYDMVNSNDTYNFWNVTTTNDVTLVYAGTSIDGDVTTVANWAPVTLATKSQVGTVQVAKTSGDYLHVKYTKEAGATEEEVCTETVEPVKATEKVEIHTFVVTEENKEEFDDIYDGKQNFDEAVASGTLPWVGFMFDATGNDDTVFHITCTYDGQPLKFKAPVDGSWYTRSEDKYVATINVKSHWTIISWEAYNELGLVGDIDVKKLSFVVTK